MGPAALDERRFEAILSSVRRAVSAIAAPESVNRRCGI